MYAKKQPLAVTFLLLFLLFSSGACALVYQLSWLREFRLFFGNSTTASAAVMAIFMGGLGLGSYWWGQRLKKCSNLLLFYGRLELGIALWSAFSPFLAMVSLPPLAACDAGRVNLR